jgi:hypothetical protein
MRLPKASVENWMSNTVLLPDCRSQREEQFAWKPPPNSGRT